MISLMGRRLGRVICLLLRFSFGQVHYLLISLVHCYKTRLDMIQFEMAENSKDWNGGYDPLNDSEERQVLFAALDSFR